MAKGSKKKTKQGEDTATTTLTVRMERKNKSGSWQCVWFSTKGGSKVMAELAKQRQTTWKSAKHLERKQTLKENQKAVVACILENGAQSRYSLSDKEKREREEKEWVSSSTQSMNTAAKPEFLGIFVKGTVKFISSTAHMIQYVGRLQWGTYLFKGAHTWQSICTMVDKLNVVCKFKSDFCCIQCSNAKSWTHWAVRSGNELSLMERKQRKRKRNSKRLDLIKI